MPYLMAAVGSMTVVCSRIAPRKRHVLPHWREGPPPGGTPTRPRGSDWVPVERWRLLGQRRSHTAPFHQYFWNKSVFDPLVPMVQIGGVPLQGRKNSSDPLRQRWLPLRVPGSNPWRLCCADLDLVGHGHTGGPRTPV